MSTARYRPPRRIPDQVRPHLAGLAIVKSCVGACNGKVYCRNLHPIGFEVVIELGGSNPA